MLNPSKVGIASGRNAIFPTNIFFKAFSTPVAIIERWIGQDEVSFQILVRVVVERAFAFPGDVRFNPSNREIHFAETPSGLVRLLAVDAQVGSAAAMHFGKFFGLHEHAAGAATRVINATLVGLDHFHQQLHYRLSGIKLAALFALRGREQAEKIFVDAAENILGTALFVAETDGADEVDQLAQAKLVQRFARVILGQHAFERRIFHFDRQHGFVQQLADTRLFSAGLRGLRFHDLRHQCITELLEGGAPEAAVLSIAGHVSRKMMEHYGHVRMDVKRKALEGLSPVVVATEPTSKPPGHA